MALNHKIALISGGTHGIGLAIKEELDREMYVTVSFSRGTGVNALNPEHIERFIKKVGRVDILINNVGGGGRWGNLDPLQTPLYTWAEVYQKNAGVAIQLTMALLPNMLERKWGRVITISSMYGKESGGRPWFTMAKSAEIAFMKEMSRIYQGTGVTFNTVCPGAIAIDGKPMGEFPYYGQPEDIAHYVGFLCSDKASFINGSCLAIDGGYSKSF